MMRNNYLLILALLLTFNVFSQTPLVSVDVPAPLPACLPGDCTGLTAVFPTLEQTTSYAATSVPYNPTFPFTGGVVLDASADDVWSPVFNLPFSFTFYGITYNKIIIGSNGVISFDIANAGGFCPWAFTGTIPSPTFPIRNAIYGVYQDTDIRNPPVTDPVTQNVNYYVLDTGVHAAPNRVFVANWNDLPLYGACGAYGNQTTQIAIHEGTNIIDIIVHKRSSCPAWNSCSGVIGTQNAAGTLATFPGGRNTGCWNATDEAWQLTPTGPANVPVTLRWERGVTPANVPVGALNENPLTVCPTGPETYTAIVEYTNPNGTKFSVRESIVVDLAPPLPVLSPQPITVCSTAALPQSVNIDQNAYMLSSVSDPASYVFLYYENQADADVGAASSINTLGDDTPLATYNLTTSPKTIYVRIENINTGCFNVRPFVVSLGSPSGTISYNPTYCNNLPQQLVTNNALTSGGTYVATPSTGLNLDPVSGAINPGSTPGIYSIVYTIAAAGACPQFDTPPVSVEILACTCLVSGPTTQTICANTLLPSMAYTASGGASSGSLIGAPAWLTGSFSSGTYYLNGAPTTADAGIYNFTVSMTSGTDVCTLPVTIEVKLPANAGLDGNTTVCENDTTVIDLFTLITGEQTGGTWTRTSGTGGTFSAATGTFTAAIGTTTSTFEYKITGVLPCSDDTSIATVNIQTQPIAGTNDSTTVCDNNTTPIDLFSLINGEQSGGTWTRTTGTGGTFTAATGTFTPAAAATTSTFTYTLAGTTPCGNATSVATVNINPQPNAGANGNTSVCDSNTAAISLAGIITGEQPGGVWTRTSGLGGVFDATLGTFAPAAGATTSDFTYTILGTAPCTNSSSVATINITAQPNAGTDGNTAACDNDVTPIDLFTLITGEQIGGTWARTTGTGGIFAAATGTFIPTGATTSTFTYTLTGTAPCVNDSSVATVNVSAQPNAGVSGSTIVCDSNTAVINLFGLITGEQPGGTWTRTTGTGGVFDPTLGTFTPAAAATTSDFSYTIPGIAPCANASSVATVNINTQPNAGIDGGTAVCDSDATAIDLFTLITGEQLGGTWTRTSGTGGNFNAVTATFTPAPGAINSSFTYTLTGTAPCINDSSLATISISAQANAGTSGSTTVCDSSSSTINLFTLITGEQAGGTWTRTSGIGGNFNAALGQFTPAALATTSTFTYTIAGIAPCSNATSIATVNINAQPNAGTNGSTTVCDSDSTVIDLYTLITGEQTGGTWTRTTGTGGTFNAATGTFTPAAAATTSTFTYTIIGAAPCVNDDSVATINIVPQVNAGTSGATTVCDSNTTLIDLYSLITGEQTGGTWTRTSGTGGTFNAALGTYTPAALATTSTFTYTINGTLPCSNATSIATININAQPDAGIDGSTTVCDSNTAAINLFNLITGEQSGGTWTRNTGSGGTFSAATGTFTPAPGATTSKFTYTILGTAPCIDDSSIVDIIVIPQPEAGSNGLTTVCDSDATAIDLFTLITGEQTGGTWTRTTGTGGNFNAAAGTFTPAAGAINSTFTYTLTGAAPCANDSSVATVNINPQTNAGIDGSTTVCDSSSAAINLFGLITGEQTGGTWTRTTGTGGTFNAAAGTFTPAAGAITSTFTYTVFGTTPCPNDTSVATVNINAQPFAGNDGVYTVCASNPAVIDLFSYITGEQAAGTWTRTSGTGGTFNAAAGTFEPAPGTTSSIFTYTITGTAPCINDSSTVSITVNPTATITLTAVGTDNQSVCINSPITNIIYNIGNGATGASITSGGLPTGVTGTYNAIAGTYTISGTPSNSGTFNYIITTTGGCPSVPATGSIEVKPKVTMLLTSDANTPFQTKCINETITQITYQVANGATGAVASGLPLSLNQQFNAADGTLKITGSVTQVGTYNFTVSTVGGCGPVVTLPGTITINAASSITLTSLPPTASQVVCLNEQLDDIVYTIANGATSASITSGTVPRGIQGVLTAGGVFTISGTPTEAGTFTYKVTTSGGCSSASISGTITVNPLPDVSLPQNGFVCVDESGNPKPGSTYVLDSGLSTAAYTFVWTDAAGNIVGSGSSYEATAPGVYTVEVKSNATGCSNTASATVAPSLPPVAIFTSSSSYFSSDQVITITVTPPGQYEYQLDTGAFQDSNQFLSIPSGGHIIHVRDKFGCGTLSTVVRIIDYPKFFTPNGDGYNDTWNIPDLSDQADAKIYIFDRYGKLLKELSPKGAGWDGIFNEKILPSSDYWFKVFFEEAGAQKEFRSHFSLKR